MKFTKIERLLLFNQYEILKMLSESEGDQKRYQLYQNIVYNGYTKFYSEFAPDFSPEQDFQEVVDILNMHRALLSSYKKLKETDLDVDDVIFKGFDVHEEVEYHAFAKFFIEDIGSFPEFLEYDTDDFNTHGFSPKISTYRKRLEKWRPIRDRDRANHEITYLTEDELKFILNKQT